MAVPVEAVPARARRTRGARRRRARKGTKLETDATARLARIESALAEARRAGLAEANKMRLEAQVREQQVLAEAQAAAHKLLTEARAQIDATLATEKANLQKHTGLLARQIAEKALGRRLA